ncbi:class I SAM-dependent methyltransferase [Candidatus Pelagibacter sp.]|nr:class I SAM-dependent methyltransferase [Candidatus Pelagibacter sp.]
MYRKDKKNFDKLIIDSTQFESVICNEGANFNTDKSPFNMTGHRHGYTAVYYLLFNHLKNKNIKIAEIGIENNSSIQLWHSYFKNAEIHGFEYHEDKINNAKNQNLDNTFYHNIDVNDASNIKNAFLETGKKFDIIIDDSTHLFNHQINIIMNTKEFLNQEGILVIEDIYKFKKKHSEKKYYEHLSSIKNEFKKIYFIETFHANNFSSSWKCEKLLVLVNN